MDYYILLAEINLFTSAFFLIEGNTRFGLVGGFGAIVFMLMAIYQKIEINKEHVRNISICLCRYIDNDN